MADHRIMRRSESGLCYFDESEFNELGYRLLKKDRTADTIEVLKLNAEAFLHSFNAHDSLDEVCIIHGDREVAIQYYRKSLELNPGNKGGSKMLDTLQEEQETRVSPLTD